MAYIINFLIAVVLAAEGVTLLSDPLARHHFHTTLDLIKWHQFDYSLAEDIRLFFVALIFASAAQLVFAWGITVAVISQFLWIVSQNNIINQHDIPNLKQFGFSFLVFSLLIYESCKNCSWCHSEAKKEQAKPKKQSIEEVSLPEKKKAQQPSQPKNSQPRAQPVDTRKGNTEKKKNK